MGYYFSVDATSDLTNSALSLATRIRFSDIYTLILLMQI